MAFVALSPAVFYKKLYQKSNLFFKKVEQKLILNKLYCFIERSEDNAFPSKATWKTNKFNYLKQLVIS
ncbi:MAG: hypothetical protein COT90_00310 [Candidatus Diapherotrites archaeon CG10_big_fil_rev_8_21_14_0_10_31_34]|nr:MAG: hypothetical protein COT90_00310 [Candidatus Diapherotrites archaeon CG10_big_fil_rev_8_21_14_0_10_31_34]